MQCNQLTRLMKDWYVHVQEESMAPARMMQFTDKHILNCETCQQDTALAEEIDKIRDFILPESKIPKSKSEEQDEATPEISPDEENAANDEEVDEDTKDIDEENAANDDEVGEDTKNIDEDI
jgi:hypothetical protein